ncbi:general secretion pathway protein GspD [Ralstonia solanacearum]|nr:general secretion pathway protein GspD [Ralstonia solanacearum]AXV86451.1 general secretion pathway protein GspD [Ralstonia solanacearum]AXW05954.1 general secretion pathway protein GspD [Ralstonia solanacearum]AXW23698.1 general secretion pathway protein GspD [Ralstonia solanacearum]AXW80630.1 general secretion pathway protein GspD [Ralstonia solanacearum]
MKPSCRSGAAREADRRQSFPDPRSATLLKGLAWAAIVTLLGGCATTRDVSQLQTASHQEPTNAQLKLRYMDERDRQVKDLLDEADRQRLGQDFSRAEVLLLHAQRLDPANERGKRIAAAIELDRRDNVILQEAERMIERGSYDSAAERVDRVLAENPNHAGARRLSREIGDKRRLQKQAADEKNSAASIMRKPVSLQFRDANVRMVFEALSRTTGLNVIFDRDVRTDLKTTIFVSNASLEDTVDMILLQSQLAKKVLNATTVFIYPATPTKQQEYQDLKVRTFQLSNTDAKHIDTLLKNLLKIKEIVTDERANTVSIRATPETIRVAERMIAAQDLPEPEVMLEVEVLEVSRDRLTDLGIDWPNSFSLGTPSSAATWGALHHLTVNQLTATGLSATANFKLTDTDANLLASPRIRTRNKEKAKILIGDKVPVISSSSVPSTSGPVYSQSIQYLDVGIKLEVEPQVYRDNDVGIKMSLEVSNITQIISSSNAQTGLSSLAYQIGTRNASTTLRLKDGETQILGGLIQDEDRDAANKVPGLGQLPVLGRLFSNHNGDHKKTEIVLQITPHIVRPQLAADADTREIWSGTDSNVRTEQLRLDPPSAAAPGAPAAALPAPAAGAAVVTAGAVGGGTTAGEQHGKANAPAAPAATGSIPPNSAFGQPPVAPRTTPPPAMFGGRFMTTVPPPEGGAPPVPPAPVPATAAPAPAGAAAEAAAPQAEAVPPASPPAAPAAQAPATQPSAVPPPASPPPVITTPPSDMPSDNPLHPIPSGTY